MGELWEGCLVCGEQLGNEICYRCIHEAAEEWLSERGKEHAKKVGKVSEMFASYTHDGSPCMMCGGNVNVCGKCYCTAVHRELKGNRGLARKFMEFAADKGFMLSTGKRVLNVRR